MVDVPLGKLVLVHERLAEGFRLMSSGLRVIADAVEAGNVTPEKMAAELRALADDFDEAWKG
jgi:hypothetical protein